MSVTSIGFPEALERVRAWGPIEKGYRRFTSEWRLVHRHADFPPADQRMGSR